jgi:hypothetical protein
MTSGSPARFPIMGLSDDRFRAPKWGVVQVTWAADVTGLASFLSSARRTPHGSD